MAKTSYLALFCFLAGCSSAPRIIPKEAPYLAIEHSIQTNSYSPLIIYGREIPEEWWMLFHDEQLSSLIEQALAANPTLQQARLKILQAAYQADFARSFLFPTFTLGGDVLREKFSETGLIPFNNPASAAPPQPSLPATGGSNGIPVYFTQYETEVFMNYDLDIWGKNRKTWDAALGIAQANAAEEIFTSLLISMAVAKVYFELQTDYQKERIALALLENQKKNLELTKLRVERHIDNLVNVKQAEVSVSEAQEDLLQLQANIATNEYKLKAYLGGDFLEEVNSKGITRHTLPSVPLPADLPLHLIAYRPDITAQLWLLYSAGQEIEIAKIGFYPDFSITGLIGYQTLHLHKLFEYPSMYYNVDPAFTLPIFDGGKLLSNLRQSEVNYDLAIAEYNDLILKAAQEVLTSLAVLNASEKKLDASQNQLNRQEEVFKLTQLKRDGNLASELDALKTEQAALLASRQYTNNLGNTLQASLNLIQSLGGGYKAYGCE
jgi:NodT family efflux transporter outer membrane factor (OMF) lipoprotein